MSTMSDEGAARIRRTGSGGLSNHTDCSDDDLETVSAHTYSCSIYEMMRYKLYKLTKKNKIYYRFIYSHL